MEVWKINTIGERPREQEYKKPKRIGDFETVFSKACEEIKKENSNGRKLESKHI